MRRPIAAVALTTFLLTTVLVTATTVRRMYLEDLVSESDLIVVARSVSSYSAADPQSGVIWTYTTLELSETIKGRQSGQLVIAELGGQVGSLAMRVSGAPRFRNGEESLLFLVRTPSGKNRVLGMFQGKMAIAAVTPGGERFVVPSVSSRQKRGQGETIHVDTDHRQAQQTPTSLSSYREQIRSIMQTRQR